MSIVTKKNVGSGERHALMAGRELAPIGSEQLTYAKWIWLGSILVGIGFWIGVGFFVANSIRLH